MMEAPYPYLADARHPDSAPITPHFFTLKFCLIYCGQWSKKLRKQREFYQKRRPPKPDRQQPGTTGAGT